MQNNRSIILLRGLPGSGKTTLARELSENGKYPVLSIDDYFTTTEGTYSFKFDENHLAYRRCEVETEQEIHRGASKILVANTFTMEWEMKPYFELAKKNGYTIFVITVENYHGKKNVHGIAEEKIEKMAAKYKTRLF
jgi:predicted kinase